MSGRGSFATRAEVAEAMNVFGARGNAVDAVIAGLFAYAALEPSVLLGPMQLLVGGPGAGLRTVDGRVRQPGLGAPRPRGFVASEKIPAAAWVGAPCFSSASLAALAAYGTRTANQCVSPSIELAKAWSSERAQLLASIARHGPGAWARPEHATPLVDRFGRMQHGLLTQEDLVAVAPPVQEAPVHRAEGNGASRPEFAVLGNADAYASSKARLGLLLAVDPRGLFCAAGLELHDEGVEVEELGVRAPLLAEPVRRGEPRVTPGTPRPAAAPIALLGRQGRWEMALGSSGAFDRALAAAVALLQTPAPSSAPTEPAGAHVLFASGSTRTL